jgi:hypothetical protein
MGLHLNGVQWHRKLLECPDDATCWGRKERLCFCVATAEACVAHA